MRAGAAFLLLGLGLTACASPQAAGPVDATPAICAAGGTEMARVELIFGLGIGDGNSGVSEKAWRGFLEKEVTPRFPDGLTAYDVYGQWQHPERGVVRLRSKVLQIWYAPTPEAEAKIQAIREAFKTQFRQLSVMRVDGRDCVSF